MNESFLPLMSLSLSMEGTKAKLLKNYGGKRKVNLF